MSAKPAPPICPLISIAAAQAGAAACFDVCVQHQCAWYHVRSSPNGDTGQCAVLTLARQAAIAPRQRG